MNLFWKIFFPVFLSFVIVAAVAAWVVIRYEISRQEAATIAMHKAMASVIANDVERSYLEGRWPFEDLRCLSEHGDFLFWWIVRDDGQIHLAHDSAFMGTAAEDYFPDATVPEDAPRPDGSSGSGGNARVELNHPRECGLLVRPLDIAGKRWSFWLGSSLKDMTVMRKRAVLLTMVVFLPTLMYLGAVLYLTVSHFTRPVELLSRAAACVGKGDLSHHVEVPSQDELGQLAASFNRMTDDLRATTVSKDYVDGIVRNMEDPLFVVDPDGCIDMANPATCDLLGYVEEELIGKPADLLFCDDEADDGVPTSHRLLQGPGDLRRAGERDRLSVHRSGRHRTQACRGGDQGSREVPQ